MITKFFDISRMMHSFAEEGIELGGGSPIDTEDNVSSTPASDESSDTVVMQDEGGSEPTAEPLQQQPEVYDWTKDERFMRMWKKDPNQLYKSYKNMEDMYEPTKQKVGTLESQLQELKKVADEYGIEATPEQLSNILTEYNSFKDPKNPLMQKASYLDSWLQNNLYRENVINFFNDLENKELERQYPNMNAQQRKQFIEMQEQINQLQTEKQAENEKRMEAEFGEEIESGISEAEAFANEKGFEFTSDIKEQLLAHCQNNEIPTKYVFQEFLRMYNGELNKAHAEKVKQGQLQNLNKNKDSAVLGAGNSPKPAGSSRLSAGDKLRSAFRKAVGAMGYNE